MIETAWNGKCALYKVSRNNYVLMNKSRLSLKKHLGNEYADHLIRAKERELDFEEARLPKF